MGAYISLPNYTRSVEQRYRLVGLKCPACGVINFPPAEICGECGYQGEFDKVVPDGRGKIYSFTVIEAGGAPAEFAEQVNQTGSYAVALVDMEEGYRVMGQLTDCNVNDIKVGAEVELVFRKIYEQEGVVRYGVKFMYLG